MDGTPRSPIVLRHQELDLSQLRKHCREQHRPGRIRGGRLGTGPMPRSNLDLAGWHYAQHHRFHLGHLHGGPWVLVRNRHTGLTVGQIPRPLGWFTGQDAEPRRKSLGRSE